MASGPAEEKERIPVALEEEDWEVIISGRPPGEEYEKGKWEEFQGRERGPPNVLSMTQNCSGGPGEAPSEPLGSTRTSGSKTERKSEGKGDLSKERSKGTGEIPPFPGSDSASSSSSSSSSSSPPTRTKIDQRIEGLCEDAMKFLSKDDPIDTWVKTVFKEVQKDLDAGNIAEARTKISPAMRRVLCMAKTRRGRTSLQKHYGKWDKLLDELAVATSPIMDWFLYDWERFKKTEIGTWLITECGLEKPAPHIQHVMYRKPQLKDESGKPKIYDIKKNMIMLAVLARLTWKVDPSLGQDKDCVRCMLNGFLTTGPIPESHNKDWEPETRKKRISQYTLDDTEKSNYEAVQNGTYQGVKPPPQPYEFLSDFMLRVIYKVGCEDLMREGLKTEALPHHKTKAPFARTFGVEQGKVRPIVYHKMLNHWATSSERMRLLGTEAVIEAIGMAMAPPGGEADALRSGAPQTRKAMMRSIEKETKRRKEALEAQRPIIDPQAPTYDPYGRLTKADRKHIKSAQERHHLSDEDIWKALGSPDPAAKRRKFDEHDAEFAKAAEKLERAKANADSVSKEWDAIMAAVELWDIVDDQETRERPPWLMIRDMSQAFFQLPVRDPAMNLECWWKPGFYEERKHWDVKINPDAAEYSAKTVDANGKRPGYHEIRGSFVAGMGNVHSIFAWVRFSELLMQICNTLLGIPLIAYVDDNIIVGRPEIAQQQLALFDKLLDKLGIFREQTKSHQHDAVTAVLKALGMDYTRVVIDGREEMLVAPSEARLGKAVRRVSELIGHLQGTFDPSKTADDGPLSHKKALEAVGSLADIASGHREDFMFSVHRAIYSNFTCSKKRWLKGTEAKDRRKRLCLWLNRTLRNTLNQGPKLIDYRTRRVAWLYTDASFPDKGTGEVPYVGGVLIRPGFPPQAFSIPMACPNQAPWAVPGTEREGAVSEEHKQWNRFGIFELEACALHIGLDLWGNELRGTRLMAKIDNVGVIAARVGGISQNNAAVTVLDRIRRLAAEKDISIWSTYVLSECNIADLFTPKGDRHRAARKATAAALGVTPEDPQHKQAATRLYTSIRWSDNKAWASAAGVYGSLQDARISFEKLRKQWAKKIKKAFGYPETEDEKIDYDVEGLEDKTFLLGWAKKVREEEREEAQAARDQAAKSAAASAEEKLMENAPDSSQDIIKWVLQQAP